MIPDRGTADQISYVLAGDVYHFAMGPGGTFYNSDWTKSGNYQFSARLTQKQAPTHPISYGLMIGGSDLASPTETYSYFLVRTKANTSLPTARETAFGFHRAFFPPNCQ